MKNIVLLLAISCLMGCQGNTSNASTDLQVDREWLESNLYQVVEYCELPTGMYSVVLLEIDDSKLPNTFALLKDYFCKLPYSVDNHYNPEDGVNCQGATLLVAKWCQKNDVVYTVKYSNIHVVIEVSYAGKSYTFDFSETPNIY